MWPSAGSTSRGSTRRYLKGAGINKTIAEAEASGNQALADRIRLTFGKESGSFIKDASGRDVATGEQEANEFFTSFAPKGISVSQYQRYKRLAVSAGPKSANDYLSTAEGQNRFDNATDLTPVPKFGGAPATSTVVAEHKRAADSHVEAADAHADAAAAMSAVADKLNGVLGPFMSFMMRNPGRRPSTRPVNYDATKGDSE